MTEASRGAAAPRLQPAGLDPFRWAWQLLTNVKFALFLVGLALIAGLIGTVLPQVPAPMRGNAAARGAWIELRREDFGALTGPMDSLELFDIFHSAWFNGLWLVIIVAVTVCTVSRFRPTMRAAQHPPKMVADGYFTRAHHRAEFATTGGAEAVESALRKRHYRVERLPGRDDVSYLFADRFAWSHYGTFVSHLALLILLIGALLTVFAGFDRTLVIAETTPAAPVFDDPGPDQLFIQMVDANRGVDDAGNIIDYHSMIEVRKGDETVSCKTTVNDPCHAFGYKVHQAAWFNDIARLRIEGPTGQLLYDDVLDFNSETATVPVVEVRDVQGRLLFNQELPQLATDPGVSPSRADDTALAALSFPVTPGSGEFLQYAAAWRFIDGGMDLILSSPDIEPFTLRPGEEGTLDGYRVTFVGARNIPAIVVADMPGATGEEGATVQMLTRSDGEPYLMVAGIDESNVFLTDGETVATGSGYTYTFGGRVEASGVSVRRDPGDTFIWVAVGMALIGLGITFYVPRRRLWVKVTPGRTYLAGIAERTTRFSREMRMIGHDLGAPDAALPEDLRGEA